MKKFFRQLAILVVLASFALSAAGQTQTPKKKAAATKSTSTAKKTTPANRPDSSRTGAAKPKPKPKAPAPTSTPVDPEVEKARFDSAIAATTAAEKVSALTSFIAEFPKSEKKQTAQESLSAARFALGDERLIAVEIAEGLKLFLLAVDEAPKPYSDRLFNEVIARVPGKLYWLGQRESALEIAASLEKNAEGNSNQLLTLANFYLGIENGGEVRRIAEAVIATDPANASAHQTLALAHRLNFDLEESAKSYAKALELDPESASAKRSLAEMKRALAKPDEAVALYREMLAKNEADNAARSGLILSLFDSGKKEEAETELAKSLEQNPTNVVLLAGVAYWYAVNNNGAKAVELATRVIEREPRYIWSHIALARGLMLEKKPVAAEQVLVRARKYGNFPTLEYEIASARLAAGFFREAAEELQKSFTVVDGSVRTRLGGRIERGEKNFADLLAAERRASIFAAAPADTQENSERLKILFELERKLRDEKPDETETAALVDAFSGGSDNMRFHRGLYAANLLLKKKLAPAKALELSRSATANVDLLLDVADPGAAVMAEELYESRGTAFSRNEFLLVPDVPRSTLSAIVRGRIEETAGLAMLQQGNSTDAVVRFRRAISVLPKDSAWWRSATWHLGSALAAEGKEKEALDSYTASYKIDKPDIGRYLIVQALYQKVNGSLDGLDAKVGPSPLPPPVVEEESAAAAETVVATETATTPLAEPQPSPSPTPTVVEEKVKEPDALKVGTENPKQEKTSEVEKPPEILTTEAKPPERLEVILPEPKPEPTVEATPEVAANPKPEKSAEADKVATVTDSTWSEPKLPEKSSEPKSEPSPEAMEVRPAKMEPANDATAAGTNTSAPETKPSSSPKPLFEPIIITIPNSTVPKRAIRSSEKPSEGSTEPKPEETNAAEEPKTEGAAAPPKAGDTPPDVQPNPQDSESEKSASPESVASGAARPRVVDGQEITTTDIPPCTIGVSQENISLINGGGSVGVLVSINDEADIKSIKATTNSPKDIEIRVEPEIAGITGRAFYVIKSISTNTGIYQILLEAPCGRKDILVKVR